VSFFAKLEQFCASFIERTFAKTFPSDLEPAQIARKLVATMEGATREDDGRLHAPGAYTVYVSTRDFERLVQHQEYLERAWADLLRDLAGRVGVVFDGKVRVAMASHASVPLGAIEIEAKTVSEGPKRYSLRTLEGVPPNNVYTIEATSTIGRSEESAIVLLDPSVSRAHAVVEIVRGRAAVRDLESTNGTFVNGRRIEREPLRDGDEIRFGNTRMRFELR
jgi:FHA domain-containing protein